MMRVGKNGLTAIMLLVFLWEGTLLKWLIPAAWQTQVTVATHFILIIVLFIGLYVNRFWALAYGLGFGLLFDVVYGGMIGTHAFATGLLGYLAGLLAGRTGIVYSMFVVTLGCVMHELILFGIYRLFRVTHVEFYWALLHVMLPSVLLNLLFALIIYVPSRKLLEPIGAGRNREAD